MIGRLLEILFTLGVLAIVAAAVLNGGNYRSMLEKSDASSVVENIPILEEDDIVDIGQDVDIEEFDEIQS